LAALHSYPPIGEAVFSFAFFSDRIYKDFYDFK